MQKLKNVFFNQVTCVCVNFDTKLDAKKWLV